MFCFTSRNAKAEEDVVEEEIGTNVEGSSLNITFSSVVGEFFFHFFFLPIFLVVTYSLVHSLYFLLPASAGTGRTDGVTEGGSDVADKPASTGDRWVDTQL